MLTSVFPIRTSRLQHKPYKTEGNNLNYGPYVDVEPNSQEEFSVHFENQRPFLSTKKYQRQILVSHWGYTSVTEDLEVVHEGGKLKVRHRKKTREKEDLVPFF